MATISVSSVAETILRAEGNHGGSSIRKLPNASHATITISRQVGTRGQAVARALGQKLNWPVYDHEILERIADDLRINVHRLEAADERPGNWLAEWADSLSTEPNVNELTYIRRLKRLLTSVADLGSSVIVGRGAAHFLSPTTTLRVRLVAPLEDRIAVIAHDRGLTVDAAARFIEQTRIERERFVRDNFHRDTADPANYDLLVNTTRFSVEESVSLIVDALRIRFPQAEKNHP